MQLGSSVVGMLFDKQDRLQAIDDLQDVRDVLRRRVCTGRQMRVLNQMYHHGRSRAEIGADMNLSAETIRLEQRSAVQQLRSALANEKE